MTTLTDHVRQIALEYGDRQRHAREYVDTYWSRARATAQDAGQLLGRIARELADADSRVQLYARESTDAPSFLLTCGNHFMAMHATAMGDRVQMTILQDGAMTPTNIYAGEMSSPRIEQILLDTLTQWFDTAL